ncbi:MAG TPA: hypothetical protein VGI54_05305 [Solirubrobacteraceae bacterium]
MSDHPAPLPSDLAALGERMRSDRPELGALELDRIKVNVMRRHRSAAPKGGFMRARLTILSFLVVGIVMMGTGGALAVSGFSSSAATAEYGPSGVEGVQAQGTLGSKKCTEQNSPTGSTANNCTPSNVAPTCTEQNSPTGSTANNCAPAPQPAQQVSSSGKSLPFTGYAAIPVLVIGIALLGTGAVMRRRTREDGPSDEA